MFKFLYILLLIPSLGFSSTLEEKFESDLRFNPKSTKKVEICNHNIYPINIGFLSTSDWEYSIFSQSMNGQGEYTTITCPFEDYDAIVWIDPDGGKSAILFDQEK